MYEALGILVGALLGALFGYWFALHQQGQELKARRDTLLELLRGEMVQVAPTLGPYQVEKAFYRDPIRISSPERLLNGGTLEFKGDKPLVQALLNLNVAIARHNDFVQVTNTAQASAPISDNIHAQWYELMKGHIAAVTAARDEVIKQLGPQDK